MNLNSIKCLIILTMIDLFFLGDIRDKEKVTLAMDGIDYVVHAAFKTSACSRI